jgi:hypothetical protein
LIDRAEEINRDPYWLDGVKSVTLFGSVLKEQPQVGDIDIAVQWFRRPGSTTAQRDVRSAHAVLNGRAFSTYLDRLYWAAKEAQLYLLKGSNRFNCHDHDPLLARPDVEKEVVYSIEAGNTYSAPRRKVRPPPPRPVYAWEEEGPLAFAVPVFKGAVDGFEVWIPLPVDPAKRFSVETNRMAVSRIEDVEARAAEALAASLWATLAAGQTPSPRERVGAVKLSGNDLAVTLSTDLAAAIRAACRREAEDMAKAINEASAK